MEESIADPLRLSELVALRLCHDFGGLLGTLTGTLELCADAAGPSSELATATEAASELTARLQLLREAWAGDGSGLDLRGLQALARGLPGAHRVRLDVSALPPDAAFPPSMARLLLNVLLLAAESLPRGGTVGLAAAGGQDVLVTISGPRAGWPPGLAASLTDKAAAWAALTGPRTLMAPLVALLASQLGIRVSILLPMGRSRRANPPPLLLSPPPG